MDITIKGWQCDLCKEKFYETSYGYRAKYSVEIERIDGPDFDGLGGKIEQVCISCVRRMLDLT